MDSDAERIEKKYRINLCSSEEPKPEPLPQNQRWWRVKELYLSDICLAAHLLPNRPDSDSKWNSGKAKDDLYALLRWLGHTAMEHDLMRPVAGVMLEDDVNEMFDAEAKAEVKTWGSDQEWHRGGFTLYVEERRKNKNPDPVTERLADLLEPVPKDIAQYETNEPRDTDTILGYIEKHINEKPKDDKISAHLSGLFVALKKWAGKKDSTASIDIGQSSPIQQRLDKISQQASDLAEGRKVE